MLLPESVGSQAEVDRSLDTRNTLEKVFVRLGVPMLPMTLGKLKVLAGASHGAGNWGASAYLSIYNF
eukprot:1359852-Amphidinium_carterae.2